MFYTYVIKSLKNNAHYIGSCEDVDERVRLHNDGMVKSTKRHVPWFVVFFEKYITLSEARKREKQLKSWKKRSAIERLIKQSKFK